MKVLTAMLLAMVLPMTGLEVMRKEIARAEGGLGLENQAGDMAQLQKAQEELYDLLTRYTDHHPKVLAKRNEIADLQKNWKLH